MSKLKKMVIRRPEVLNVFNTTEEAGVDMIAGVAAYGDRGLPSIGEAHQIVLETNRDIVDLSREIYLSGGIEFPGENQICYLDGLNNESIHDVIEREFEKVYRYIDRNGIKSYQPFIYSERSEMYAKLFELSHLTSFHTSERINNKAIVQSELKSLAVLTPEGKLVKSKTEAKEFALYLYQAGYKSVGVKLVRAASGMGVFEVEIEDILNGGSNIFEKYSDELSINGLLIDGWISGEVLGSPNIQFWINDSREDDVFVCASNQILKADEGGVDKIHIGNISSPELMEHTELNRSCRIIRDYCRKNNYRGLIGIDFLHCIENGEHKFYFMEINARLNGSTTGGVIGGINGFEYWGVNNGIKTNRSPEGFIEEAANFNLLYNSETRSGILPTNLSTIKDSGKAMVFVTGSSQEQVREFLSMASEIG